MSEPDQILAQQANQSIALMQAIGQNTQRAFENRFRVQAAQMATGIQVAGQIEEYRMNDARLAELSQTMRIRDQEFQWKKADQAFEEKIRPLEFQVKQLDFQNKFRAQAEQRMSPFLTDIKGEFQQFVMDNPNLASEAQSTYVRAIDDITNRSLSDPSVDVQSLLETKKNEMRAWIEKEKEKTLVKPKIGGLLGAGIDAANKMLGTSFDPLKDVKIKEKSAPLSKDQSSMAASIYSTTFGGVPQDFLRKHDPLFSGTVDSSYKLMMTTGKLTSKEDYDNLSQEQRADVLKAIDKENKRVLLQETIKTYQKDLNDMMDSNRNGDQNTSIAAARKKLMTMQEQYAKDFLGVDYEDPKTDPKTPRPDTSGILGEVSASSGSAVETSQARGAESVLSSDFENVSQIIKKISPVSDSEIQSVRQKYIQNPDSVTSKDIEKLISKVGDGQIDGLANTDWFKNYIDENNLDITGSGDRAQQTTLGRAMQILTSEARPFMEDIFSPSPKRIFTSNRDRAWTDKEKQEARKVLQSKLPNILFDYLNQSR
jgi:hypothetical protein